MGDTKRRKKKRKVVPAKIRQTNRTTATEGNQIGSCKNPGLEQTIRQKAIKVTYALVSKKYLHVGLWSKSEVKATSNDPVK